MRGIGVSSYDQPQIKTIIDAKWHDGYWIERWTYRQSQILLGFTSLCSKWRFEAVGNGSVRIYALVVCFSSLMCGAVATGFGLFNLIKVVAPESTISPETLNMYSSNEEFRKSLLSSAPVLSNQIPPVFSSGQTVVVPQSFVVPKAKVNTELSETEIEALRSKKLKSRISNHRFRARQGLYQQVIALLICAALFFSHWKLITKLSKSVSAEKDA